MRSCMFDVKYDTMETKDLFLTRMLLSWLRKVRHTGMWTHQNVSWMQRSIQELLSSLVNMHSTTAGLQQQK